MLMGIFGMKEVGNKSGCLSNTFAMEQRPTPVGPTMRIRNCETCVCCSTFAIRSFVAASSNTAAAICTRCKNACIISDISISPSHSWLHNQFNPSIEFFPSQQLLSRRSSFSHQFIVQLRAREEAQSFNAFMNQRVGLRQLMQTSHIVPLLILLCPMQIVFDIDLLRVRQPQYQTQYRSS